MHIPDGFLDAKTAVGTAVFAAVGLAVALRHARHAIAPRKVPLLGLSAAFVFAAQMVNFPVAGGTSGHLVGGVLTAALLGPSAAVIVLATVLIVQCLAFADGGITALGANLFNMGIIAGVGGWMIYFPLTRLWPGIKGKIVAAVVASWMSTVLAAMVCAGELAASGTVAWEKSFAAMTGWHMLIGIGEGLITALVLAAIASVRPELLEEPAETGKSENAPSRSYKPLLAYGLLTALGIAVFVAPFASSLPDGLEKTIESLGLKPSQAGTHDAPLADYKIPGMPSLGIATALAGVAGTLLVFGIGLLTARALSPRKQEA